MMLMMDGKYLFMALTLWLSSLEICEPIMVEFGTSEGPILPIGAAASKIIQTKTTVVRSPAPVKEVREDIPNPNHYRPPIPHQYRENMYSFKPLSTLILGTPLDQRYSPSLQKNYIRRNQYSRNLGLDYTGPHIFEQQDYELSDFGKTTPQTSVRYREEKLQHNLKTFQKQKYVPQIGVIYSAGVRYYIPQIAFISSNGEGGKDQNSVYDKNDKKYFVYNAY